LIGTFSKVTIFRIFLHLPPGMRLGAAVCCIVTDTWQVEQEGKAERLGRTPAGAGTERRTPLQAEYFAAEIDKV
jgi:hypothetical protein